MLSFKRSRPAGVCMGKNYALSNKAKADLIDIWDYTESRWGEQQADKYYRDIFRTISLLAAGHRQGRISKARQGYLKYAVGKHHVYFRVSDTGIDVIRILHQSMSVERNFDL